MVFSQAGWWLWMWVAVVVVVVAAAVAESDVLLVFFVSQFWSDHKWRL